MPLQNLKNTWKSIRENAESGNRKKGRAVYEEFKYMLQDVNRIYIGAKYTYRELMEHPETAFKFNSVIEHYLLKDTDPDTSLESDFYYMRPDSFSYRTYEQLKVKCRISVLTEKKGRGSTPERVYREQTLSLQELAAIPSAQKKKDGIVVQEIILSKIALISFVV